MDDPDTMPNPSRALRSFHAIRHLPPSRIGWRLLQRTRRRLPAAMPSLTHARLRQEAARLPNLRRTDRVLAVATEKMRQQGLTDARWRNEGTGRLAVTIHGRDGSLDVARPVRGSADPEQNLWCMSASYLNYLLVPDETTRAGPARFLAPLAEAYGSLDSWREPKVHDREWHPYAASQRLVSLICLSALHASEMDDSARSRIDAAILLHTRYVTDHREYDLHYNHLLKNLFALLLSETYRAGAPTPERVEELLKAVDYQLHEDGGHTELCPMYHLLVLADLIQLQALPDGALSAAHRHRLDERVERMRAAARVMMFAHGEIALFGDSWLGEAPPPEALGIRCRAVEGEAVSSERLSRTGYAKLATARVEAIIDVGAAGPPDNPGHAHDDYLALELSLSGRKVVSDYGVEAYAAGEGRVRTRSAASHNGPTFDGARGIDAWGAFRTGRRRGAPTIRSFDGPGAWRSIEAVHRPLDARGIALTRRVSLHPRKGLVIRDTWLGVAADRAPRSIFLLLPTPERLRDTGFRYWSPGATETDRGAGAYQEFGVRTDTTRLTIIPSATDAFLLFVPCDIDPRSVHEELLASSSQPD